jgi:hypothetical protein
MARPTPRAFDSSPRATMSSRAFRELADRPQIPDPDALELIGYPGKIGESGKRPRLR